MRTVVIIQARIGSERLAGKTTMELTPIRRSMLAEVIRRCKLIDGVDDIVCAVPERDEEILGPIVKGAGALLLSPKCEENDLLSRYLMAAEAAAADIIVRITADCPRLDPVICGRVIALRAERNATYAKNAFVSRDRKRIAGNCEVFTIGILREAASDPWLDAYDREHVGPAILHLAKDVPAVLNEGCDQSVDTIDDFREVCRLFAEELAEAA